MKLLSFDTCLNKTYVTLSKDGNVLESKIIENKDEKYHSAFLISCIADILKKYKISMQNIDAIATNVGPGSFTGIRACVTVARVIAQQLECPLVGVSSLEILSHLNKNSNKTVVLLDARKGQFYIANYDEQGQETTPPKLINAQDCENFDDCTIIADESVKNYLEEKGIKSELYNEFTEDLGVILNKIAYKKLEKKGEYHWAKLKPLYLQAPPISKQKVTK